LDYSNDFSIILFTVGDNASHAQDTVPSDPAVTFDNPSWDTNFTELSSFRYINTPPQYVTTGIPSISGNYRIGLHPDKNLIQHYGRPVAVLLTDYYESGVYDAVYVDLDNDKSFADEIPMMKYGAYNDTNMIGPKWGTQRLDNGSVIHNGIWYPMKKYSTSVEWANETLTSSAAGGETVFYLGNDSVDPASLVVDRPTQHTFAFSNDSVVYIITDLEVTPWSFFLPDNNLDDASIIVHYYDGFDHYYDLLLSLDPTAIINLTTGEVNLTDSGLWDSFLTTNGLESAEFYAWYNFTESVNMGFVFDAATSKLTLTEALTAGDYLNVMYSYESVSVKDIGPANKYGTIIYNDNPVKLELRDWTSNKDIDAEGGTGDGMIYPDLSGGMAYFIADGTNYIPYSDIYCDRNGIVYNPVPENGGLIAFFGEFEVNSITGTQAGSAICAVGTGVDNNGNVLVKGMAPKGKLIPVRQGNPFDAWYFTVEGYDGIIGNSDNAQIVALTTSYPVMDAGWDVYSRALDYISMVYAEGKTIFVAGTGTDDGSGGYGTGSSPGSSAAVITAGIGTQFNYRNYNPGAPISLNRVYADGGPNSHHGDILPSSGRGQNMLGNPEPDVITAGAFLFGSTPLNVDQETTNQDFKWFGGQWAWDLWSGTSLSSSSTAGILALIYDAYYTVNGEYPDIETARSLLKSGADNLNYDILVQGSGNSNADRSTKLAANIDGIYLSKSYWVPGDYRGTQYNSFTKIMGPGDSASEPVTITNMNATVATNIEIQDSMYRKFGECNVSMNITTIYDDLDTPGIMNIEPFIAIGTELLKVTAISPKKPTMQTYMAEFFDWTDDNENGLMEFPGEQNRIAYVIGTNSLELRYRDPIGQVNDGLAIQIKSFGGSGEALIEWTIILEFYGKTDWDWVNISGAPTTLAAGANSTFDMNIDVPIDADIGSYEGAVYVNEKVPEELIATGVGLMKYNVPFKMWFYISGGGTEAIINDDDLLFGNRTIVPKSTAIYWNGTRLYEDLDYTVSSFIITFVKEFPANTPIPPYATYFNITYLTVQAESGNPIENAAWAGQLSVLNLVKSEYILRKDGIIWDETEVIVNENLTWAVGGETIKKLDSIHIVRATCVLLKNGVEWAQFNNGDPEDPNYLLNLDTGVLTFTNPLLSGDKITANYSSFNYTVNRVEGIIKFTNALLPGVYVTCEYWHYESVIPIFVNVAANSLPFTFGGNTGTSDLYDNNRVYGASGDCRMFFLDIPDSTEIVEGKRLLVDLNWTSDLSDIEVFVYGNGTIDFNSWNHSERYGPYTLEYKGGSNSQFTTIDSSREVITADLSHGLNVIIVRGTAINGDTNYEEFSGTVGTMSVQPSPIDIITNQLYDRRAVTFESDIDWEGIETDIYGFEVFDYIDQEVWQDDNDWSNYATFEEQLSSGSTTVPFVVNDCSRINVHIWGYADAPDLDLGIFLDGKNGNPIDGITQVDEFVGMDADSDSDEEATIVFPVDGIYLIKIFGFTVTTQPAHYDMQVTLVSPTYVPYFHVEDLDSGFLPSTTPRSFNLTWDFLGSTPDGTYLADLFVGPTGALCVKNEINLLLDRTLPAIENLLPLDDSTIYETQPLIGANYSDVLSGIDVFNIKITFDGTDVTGEAILGPLNFAYTPSGPLGLGLHAVELEVPDVAGNINHVFWLFTVGENTPPIIVHEPVTMANVGEVITISCNVTDDYGLNSVMLYYKNVGDIVFSSFIMNYTGNNTYTGNIPAQSITGNVSYYIEANDGTYIIKHPSAGEHLITITTFTTIPLIQGWNLVSLPLVQTNTSVLNVLSSIEGKWDVVKYYDNTNKSGPWKTYRPGATTNDLADIDNTMGFWIKITQPNVNLTVRGIIPTSTTIPLYAGWNLVGYPTQTTETVGNALWGTGADKVEVFDSVSPYIKEVGPTYVMKPGEGYWVRVPADVVWTIDW